MTELVYSHKLKYVPDIQGLIIGFLFIYISTGISHLASQMIAFLFDVLQHAYFSCHSSLSPHKTQSVHK